MELFPERTSDLERLEEYLEAFDIVGVNGGWGSGKTFLEDEFIRKHNSEFPSIPDYAPIDKPWIYYFKG